MDPSLQTTLENRSLNSHPSGQIPHKNPKSAPGIRAPQFRYLLGKRNIFINTTDPSPELVKRAKEIITKKALFPEMDDTLAKELEGKAWQLETKPEEDLITELFTPLIPALERVPYQSLARSKNRMCSYAVDVPYDPEVTAVFPPLPKSKPYLVFGYSQTSFNVDQLMASDLLVAELNHYAMPDGIIRFSFFDLEFKAQATGGTHFLGTNQLANAGAVAIYLRAGAKDFSRGQH